MFVLEKHLAYHGLLVAPAVRKRAFVKGADAVAFLYFFVHRCESNFFVFGFECTGEVSGVEACAPVSRLKSCLNECSIAVLMSSGTAPADLVRMKSSLKGDLEAQSFS